MFYLVAFKTSPSAKWQAWENFADRNEAIETAERLLDEGKADSYEIISHDGGKSNAALLKTLPR